jgi:dTDP-4-dehydrorhamnose 3,5-epimerase
MGNELIMNNPFSLIDGVFLTPLKCISDERGAVLHFLRSDSKYFKNFGEAYFSLINYGVVKGWKKHKIINQNFCVPHGQIKFVIYDNRHNSSTKGNIQEILLDNNSNYNLLTLPPNLWYSFRGIGQTYSLLANIIDVPHSKEESVTLPLNTKEIPYDWE